MDYLELVEALDLPGRLFKECDPSRFEDASGFLLHHLLVFAVVPLGLIGLPMAP